jgi:AcrR family transcriptional regulator
VATTHPTKTHLIETAVALIDEHGAHGFTVDGLLEKSKISKGSLYHHFSDFGDVIEQAQIVRFARSVDEDAALLISILSSSTSVDDLFSRIELILTATTQPERSQSRLDRAAIIGTARHSTKFAQALSVEQQRLTTAFADMIHEIQNRGWIRNDIDPQVIATFIQAYSLGYVLNDITAEPVSGEAWKKTVAHIIRAAFGLQ